MGEELNSLHGKNQKRKKTDRGKQIMKSASEDLFAQTVSAAWAGGVSEKDLKVLVLQFDAAKTKAMITLRGYNGRRRPSPN